MGSVEIMTIAAALVCGFIAGIFSVVAYMLLRMMQNDDWDDSNLTNALRLLSHVVLHPKDFGKMYYVPQHLKDKLGELQFALRKPFWYVDKDELSQVVKTRPRGDE